MIIIWVVHFDRSIGKGGRRLEVEKALKAIEEKRREAERRQKEENAGREAANDDPAPEEEEEELPITPGGIDDRASAAAQQQDAQLNGQEKEKEETPRVPKRRQAHAGAGSFLFGAEREKRLRTCTPLLLGDG